MRRYRYPTCALTILAALVCAPGAAAQNKTYGVVIDPPSVSGGTTGVPMTAEVTNFARNQTLGSVNLTPPTGFTVTAVSTDRGTVSIDGGAVALRDLSLPANETATVSMTLDVPGCTPPRAWSALAKQANDFNGTGNDFTLNESRSQMTTAVTGGCVLDFGTEPEDAEKTQTISGARFDPDGAPVTVRVEDTAGNLVDVDGLSVAVSRGLSQGLGTLGGTLSRPTQDGVAAFDDLTVSLAGLYRLYATASGATADTSAPFTVVDDAVPCLADVACGVASSNDQIDLSAQSDAGSSTGFAVLSLSSGAQIDCTGYTEFSGAWAVIDGPARSKTITYTIAKSEMRSQQDRGAASLNICFAYPSEFTQKPGTPLDPVAELFDFDGDGDLDPGYRGLLPDCGTPGATQCVASRNKTGAGQGVIVVHAPALAGDPAYRG